jgi:B12-binding domain/radical SAM domain protein
MTPWPFQVLFLYVKEARYSIHALAGALDTDTRFDSLDCGFCASPPELHERTRKARLEGRSTLLCLSFTSARAREMDRLILELRALWGETTGGGGAAAFSGGSPARLFILGGGAHATALPERCLRSGFDAVVHGEGEETFLEMLDCLREGRDWREVRGIACIGADGLFRRNPRRPPLDLDRFPSFSARRGMVGHIELTRGCPFACSFCQTAQLNGVHPRHRGMESVLRHIEAMRRAGRADYRFITPNAFGYGSPDGRELRVDALRGLLEGMREAAGPEGRIYFGSFPSEVRPEHVNDETVGLVRRLCDNDTLVVGAQSGGDAMLEACRRGHGVEEILRATECVLRNGLKVGVDFIFGLPGETSADLESTIDLMTRLAAMGARIHTHTFMPIPGTPWADEPPGRISRRLLGSLHRLVSQGHAYGNWREQEGLARQIARMGRGHI